ncbi:MAG TPA: hypothetical protein VIV07_07075 [Sphingomicrobium sp.]
MTRTPLLITLAAAAALAGCNKDGHTIVGGSDAGDNETNVAANTPIALPPSITASKIYRCADDQVVYVDWMSDNKSANVRTTQGGPSTQVTTAEAGKPMTAAGGYSLSGSPTAGAVKIAVPGHPSQTCNT